MISILLIVIQTAIPRYNTKHNLDFNLLEINDTNYNNPDRIELNTKIIDYFHMKVKKLSNSYLSEELWFHYKELSDENKHFDVVSVKSQIINCIKMIVSPRCPSVIQRINEYYKFVKGVTGKYVRDEWPIFKPLRDNKMIKDVDEFINETIGGDFKHFILNYNNHPVENICLLSGLTESSDKLIHELLKIPTSEIMMNKCHSIPNACLAKMYSLPKPERTMSSIVNSIDATDSITEITFIKSPSPARSELIRRSV